MIKKAEYLEDTFFEDDFLKNKRKPLTIEIPFEILCNTVLSLNEKLLFGLDFTFEKKLGFNQMTNKKIGDLLNIHPNIVSNCRKNLVQQGFLEKDLRKYYITDHYKNFDYSTTKDFRNVMLPIEIYNSYKLKTGEKLLWGEYNSISKGERYYFAKREYTSKRLGVSVESISNWTTSLYNKGFFKEYKLQTGYCTHQRKIITCSFKR